MKFWTAITILCFFVIDLNADKKTFKTVEVKSDADMQISENMNEISLSKEPSVQKSVSDLTGETPTRVPQSNEDLKVVLKKADSKVEPRKPEKPQYIGANVQSHSKIQEGSYSVQLASYTDKMDSEALLRKVQDTGLAGFIQPALVKGIQYYRVKVGPFATKEEAKEERSKIAQMFSRNPFVVRED